jgi:hypothetical protein
MFLITHLYNRNAKAFYHHCQAIKFLVKLYPYILKVLRSTLGRKQAIINEILVDFLNISRLMQVIRLAYEKQEKRFIVNNSRIINCTAKFQLSNVSSFWDMMTCLLVRVHQVSEERNTSIF